MLVIEDEADISELIAYNLEREGFQVTTRADGEDGLAQARQEVPDLVLLDLMLPSVDGIEVCRQLRADNATKHVPVIMVTAKGEESDVVVGLGMGADDYVTKPFSPRELTARVKAMLRRARSAPQGEEKDRIGFLGVQIDASRHEVKVDNERQSFTATEFRLLHFLANHPGRVFTRDQIIERVIGEGAIVIDRNIDVHVRAVRKKLGPYRDCIETVRGVGYRFSDED
ncbi:MAG: response regulator [Planctomycetota bacterium]|nr:response regulator [Planctomycetota bacterium]